MKVTFIYPDINSGSNIYGNFHFGIACLSGALKSIGHKVSLAHFLQLPTRAELLNELTKHDADIFAISYTEEDVDYVSEWLPWIKEKFVAPVIAGGFFPTLNPNEAINLEGCDIICIGEGEYSLIELCNRIEGREPYDDIESLWIKQVLKNIVNF